MIVNPGIRRFLGSAIQRLFNSASVSLPLTHTAVPQRAATGTTATFTRATTATFRDWEGVLKTVPSGCARFEGARMVRNLLLSSENLLSGWIAAGAASVTPDAIAAPTGAVTADALIEDNTSAFHRINHNSITRTSGQVIVVSVYAKYAGRNLFMNWSSFCNATGAFDLQTGVVTQGAGTASIEEVGDGWYRCSVKGTCSSTGADNGYLQLTPTNVSASYAGDGVSGTYFWGAQLEEVTGQADQSAGEYVSVGVESAPYYHGSFVDGVKYFDTDLSGNPIAASTLLGYLAEGARTNLCLQSNAFTTTWGTIDAPAAVQNVIGPDGATSAWTVTDANAGTFDGYTQSISASAGGVYCLSLFIKKAASATAYPLVQLQVNTAVASYVAIIVNHVAGTINVVSGGAYVAPVASRIEDFNSDYWRVQVSGTQAGGTLTIAAQVYPAASSNGTTLSAAAQGSAVFYGAQVELGSFASSYIATTTAAVARNADVESVSTNGNIAAAAGSIYLEYTPTHTPSGTIALWGTYVDASNYTAILHDATNLIFRKRIAGSNYDATIANAFVSGTTYKVAATWGAAGTAIYLDGVAGTPHANTTAAQIAATMQVGADGNSLQQPGAGTTNLRIWQRQLSISEGVAVTA